MKKTLNLALVLMATAVSLTLTSCGGGGGGGDTTPNGGTNGGTNGGASSNGGGSYDYGYAPRTLDGKYMVWGDNYEFIWEFYGNTAYLSTSAFTGSGTYTYTPGPSANKATLSIDVTVDGGVIAHYETTLEFHSENVAVIAGSQDLKNSSGTTGNYYSFEFPAYFIDRS